MKIMQIYPVGIVKHWAAEEHMENTVQVEVYDKFSAGLKGIENADYLWIMFWMHRLSENDRKMLQVHPRGDVKREKKGIFALRSPMRPNPIGLTKVRLVKRKGNTLIVEGLDALDETPVIDIKPG